METERFAVLKETAIKFRAFILAQHPDEDVINRLASFQEGLLMLTVTTIVSPALIADTLDTLIDPLMEHLSPDDPAAVRNKIRRYLEAFHKIAISISA